MEPRFIALIIFCAAYIFFVVAPAYRAWIAMTGAVLLVLTGTLAPKAALFAINWNVIGVFFGMLVMAELFIESRVPAYVAVKIIQRSKNACMAILFLCGLAGIISAFVENVATLMIIAPIALSMARKLNIHPMKPLIAIAVSSNLQGAATLIGDPPSMLLAGFTGMNFIEFFFYKGKPSLFFAVQIGALASFIFLYLLFKKHRLKTGLLPESSVKTWFPSVLLIAVIASLAIASFVDPDFRYLAGALCMIGALFGAIWDLCVNGGSFLIRIKRLDWDTVFFLMGVFVLVGAITASNWTQVFALSFSSYIGENILIGFILMVIVAIVFSAFVDNIPFLAAMLPVAKLIADNLAFDATLLLFGLVLGASIGGNITPIGAASNIVCVGLLKKNGYNVKFVDFIKIGLPFTIVATAAASLFVWLVWGPP